MSWMRAFGKLFVESWEGPTQKGGEIRRCTHIEEKAWEGPARSYALGYKDGVEYLATVQRWLESPAPPRRAIQRSAKDGAPGCVSAAGKLRQK